MITPAPGPSAPAFDLDHFLPYRLAAAADRVSAGLSHIYRAEAGLSVAEWRVLAHLFDAGPASVRDIGARAGLEKSRVSRAAARLEAAGHITRGPDPADRRLVCLELTGAGRALMAALLAHVLAYQATLEARLGPLLAPLERALDTLRAEGDQPRR